MQGDPQHDGVAGRIGEPGFQAPDRQQDHQRTGEDQEESPTGELEAFPQRLQRTTAAQHQAEFGEGQLHHDEDARQDQQRQAEHDQQRSQRRE